MNRSRRKAIGALVVLTLALWGILVAMGPRRRQAVSGWLASASLSMLPMPPGGFGVGPAGSP